MREERNDRAREFLDEIVAGSLFIEVRAEIARAVVLGSGQQVFSSQGEKPWTSVRRWVESARSEGVFLCVDEQEGNWQDRLDIPTLTREVVASSFARRQGVPLIVFDWNTTYVIGPLGDCLRVGKGERAREILAQMFAPGECEESARKRGESGNVRVLCGEDIVLGGVSGATQASEIAAALEEALVFGAVSVLEENSSEVRVIGVDAWHERAAELVGALTGRNVRCLIDDFWPARLLELARQDCFIAVEVSGGERGPRGRYRAWCQFQEG